MSADAAACCAEFYEQDWVRTLLGDSFHPGGPELSRRAIEDLHLSADQRVLDLACGTGITSYLLSEQPGVEVVGLDYSTSNLERARQRAPCCRPLTFVQGTADALPFDSDSFDAVICECAVSTFADKPTVAREIARVLRPGGRLAISDMAVYDALPNDLAAFGRGWSCVDDALPLEGYRRLFEAAGLTWRHTEDESEALKAMLLDLKRKLVLVAVGQLSGVLEGMQADLPTLRDMLARARRLVDDGSVRYGRLAFERPATGVA